MLIQATLLSYISVRFEWTISQVIPVSWPGQSERQSNLDDVGYKVDVNPASRQSNPISYSASNIQRDKSRHQQAEAWLQRFPCTDANATFRRCYPCCYSEHCASHYWRVKSVWHSADWWLIEFQGSRYLPLEMAFGLHYLWSLHRTSISTQKQHGSTLGLRSRMHCRIPLETHFCKLSGG